MKRTYKLPLIQLQTFAILAALFCVGQAALAASQAVWIAIVGTSANTNWSTLANWQSSINPSGNNCVFNDATGQGLGNTTVNNVVDINQTPGSLTYTNLGTEQNTLILSGMTLFVTNGLTVGNTSVATNANPVTTISGAGATLVVSNSTMGVGQSYSAAGGASCTLNMSGLSTFIATNMNHLYAGVGSVRMTLALYLATNNYVYFTGASTSTSPHLDIGDNSSNNGPGDTLFLGQTNIFSVNDIGIGLKKQNSGAEIEFNSAFTGSSPIANFYGTNGTSSRVATWAIGDGQTAGGTITCQGKADFTGGTVTALVNSMWLGRDSTGANAGTEVNQGTLTFSVGTINVNNLTNGWIVATNIYPQATGIINVNDTAVLSVNNNFVLATTNTGLNLSFATVEAQGELNIDGGTVEANKITTGGMGNSGNGVGGYIDMTGGMLIVTNILGTPALPMNFLLLSSSPTLQLAAASSVANAQVINLENEDSSTCTINISSIPPVAAFPSQFPVIAYQNGSGSGAPFALGTMPAGYMGYVSNDNSSTIWLVVTNGPLLVWGGGVNNSWDTTSLNWTNNGVTIAYSEGNAVFFNDLAQVSTVNLASSHAPLGWAVTNSVLNYTFTGSGVTGLATLTKSGTQNLTLTESGDTFSGGITALAGTTILDNSNSTISGGLTISTGAAVQIGNNDTNGALPAGTISDNGTLIFDQTSSTLVSSAITGSGGLTQEGSGTLTLSGVSSYAGNTMVSAGTLALTNGGSIAGSGPISVNNATLDVSGASGAVTLTNLSLDNSTLNVSVGYLRTNLTVNSLAMSGTVNTINVNSLPPIATFPSTNVLLYAPNGITGYNFMLGSLPSGFHGTISQNGNTVVLDVTSGTTGTRPYVTWSGSDVPNLNTNWTDNLNWLAPGEPVAADNVIFTGAGAPTASAISPAGGGPGALNFQNVNNIINANFTVSSLTYTNIGTNQNTYINDGDTLTITNSSTNAADIFTVGSSTTDFGTNTESVTIAGPNGTINVNNTNNNVQVGVMSALGAVNLQATLDMSALGTFNATVSSFRVGALPEDTTYVSGIAYLARTNVITAVGGTNNESGQNESDSFMVGENGKTAALQSFLYLGQANTINANYIGVGLAKESGIMLFNPVWANPAVKIRGADGVSPVAVWSIGDALAQTGASTAPAGTNDFTGGTVDALATLMYVGRTPNVSGANATRGVLTFGAGKIAVATLYAGYQSANDSDFGLGTINVNGTGLLQAGTLNLGLTTGATTNTTTGTLNINGGTVQVNTIVTGTITNTASVINLTGGTLVISNTAGKISAPVTSLNLIGGTLQINVNGAANATNVIATAITTSGTTTLQIGALAGVTTGVTYPLIAYTGTDPYSSLNLVLPGGYVGSLVDNPGVVGVQLTVAPPSAPPRFNGIHLNGNTLTMSGTNGTSGGFFVLLESTNLMTPIPQWVPILTNSYNSSGAFTIITNINLASPLEFYLFTNAP